MASRTSRRLAIASAVAILSAGLAGGVVAATTSSDEAALAPARASADRGIEQRVDALLGAMTLEEKLQQVQLLSDGQVTDADAQAGVGGVFSLTDPERINELQHIAVEKSRLGHPDPVRLRHHPRLPDDLPGPAGRGELVRPGGRRRPTHRIGARESADGRAQADLQPDGRRLPRAALGPDRRGRRRGPVPRLGDGGRARQGRPGQRLRRAATRSSPASSTSSAYGQPEGGRDYNTTDMSESRLRNLYLPPFKAAIDAGVGHGDVLVQRDQRRPGLREQATPRPTSSRSEWGFDGFIESDYTAVAETPRLPAEDARRGPVRPRHRGRRPGGRRRRR